ncbi:MAG: hypothetical protein JW703_02125 [Candidatus Diapherotrites archaeon]|nr:hypothetical protein [Candidatus Diapherotrites archaeon]
MKTSIKKGFYLSQFITREILNDLFERMYSDNDINADENQLEEEILSIGNITIEKNSVIGARTVLNGNIKIGKNTFIGQGATIKGNILIGNNCYIEAGTVLTKNISNNTLAYGNPLKTKKLTKKINPKKSDCIREPQKKPLKDIFNFFKLTCYIEKNVEFGKQIHIEGGGKIEIEENSKIGNRVVFLSTNHPSHPNEDLIENEQQWYDIQIGKNVTIEDNCVIRGGVTIGDNALIKAGSIVTKTIEKNSISQGCPAKPNKGTLNILSVKFPHISNIWAVTGHMYPVTKYFNSFEKITIKQALINNELMIVGNQSVKIDSKTLIGPRVTLVTETPLKKGEIKIGKNCFIGARAIILPGVIINDGAIIGAGSIVNKNVEKNEIWVGNIAKKIKDKNY